MVGAFDYGSRGLGSSPGQDIVFFGQDTLLSQRVSPHPGV